VRARVCVCVCVCVEFYCSCSGGERSARGGDIIKLVPRVFREASFAKVAGQPGVEEQKLTRRGAKARAGNDLNYLVELSPLITERARRQRGLLLALCSLELRELPAGLFLLPSLVPRV
jgi:hypothetical protein